MANPRKAALEAAQGAAFLDFLDRHGLDPDYADPAEWPQEWRDELAAVTARVDAEHGYDPATGDFTAPQAA